MLDITVDPSNTLVGAWIYIRDMMIYSIALIEQLVVAGQWVKCQRCAVQKSVMKERGVELRGRAREEGS